MASVNFEKFKTSQQVKAMLRHCDKEERKKTENHANKDIDLQATGRNLQMKRSYAETAKRYDDKITYLDSLDGANKRKDRVTCFGLNVPVPKGLSKANEKDWFNNVYRIIGQQYGKENVLQLYVHRDEVHQYKDAETNENAESRVHGHYYVVPEHDGKLNGKWFSSRANMNKLNNAIHKMTQEQYGLDFMTGTKKKSTKSVEQLKAESNFKAVQAELDKQRKVVQEMRQNALEIQQKAQQAIKACDKRQTELDEREAKIHHVELIDKPMDKCDELKHHGRGYESSLDIF